MPASATRMRRTPSKWNGLVTTPTVRMPSSLRAARDHRRGAGAGAAAHAGGDEHHVRARRGDRGSRRSPPRRRRARPRAASRRRDLRSTCTPIWMMRSAFDMVSAWASVLATTKSTPCSPARDHVVDGVAAGAADPEHGDPRLQLADVGDLQIDASWLPLHTRASATPPRRAGPPPAAADASMSGHQKLSRSHRPTRAI